jgi:hypothetical protein
VVSVLVVAALAAATACTRPPSGGGGHDHHTLFGTAEGASTNIAGSDVVTLDAATIDGDPNEIQIDMPEGRVTARKDKVVRRGHRSATWFGRTPGRGDSNVTVTVEGDAVSAAVDTDSGETVAATSTGKGVGLRTKLDKNVLKDETDPEASAEDLAAAAALEPEVSVQAEGDAVIDVLIVYNSVIARQYGTQAGVRAVAQRQIDRANKSFTDSQIKLQYRIVYVGQVADSQIARSYWGGGNLSAMMRSTVVANLRNQYGADLVQAWGSYPNVCGQGYQPTVANQPGAGYGFSVIHSNRSCTEGQAVSHELGHNIGGGHDRITSNRPSGGGDAYGMVDRTGRFLTIMGYPQSCGTGCTQSWLYSNPSVQFRGRPTGVAGSVDNARVMNIIGPRVAAFRAPRV